MSLENFIDFYFLQYQNVCFSDDLTNLGIVIDSKLMHKENALFPIFPTKYSFENITYFDFYNEKIHGSSIDLILKMVFLNMHKLKISKFAF